MIAYVGVVASGGESYVFLGGDLVIIDDDDGNGELTDVNAAPAPAAPGRDSESGDEGDEEYEVSSRG